MWTRRQVLGGLTGLGALTLTGCAAPGARPAAAAGGFPTVSGTLNLPASPVLAPERRLTRIGLGSCFHQNRSGALLHTAMRTKPDLFLFMGDNVYGDSEQPDLDELVGAYAAALARPDYRAFREAMPIAAVWDDHDFGLNDAGATYAWKQKSRPLFFDFWGVPLDHPRRATGGIYDAFVTGPKGARVQTILLDTRMFRDDWTPTDREGPGQERYIANPDPARTVLGAAQWAWLEDQFARPADLRIVVSSYQLVADGHGWERWGLFPTERQRFYDLIAQTGANGVVLVSGDRHRAGLYRETKGTPYPIYEITSSAMNMGWDKAVEPPEEAGPNRIGGTFRQNNVGLVTLDWDARKIGFFILDEKDRTALSHSFGMDELKAA